MVFETERLVLREMKQNDLDHLSELLQDEIVMYAYQHAFTNDEVQEWLDKQLMRYRKNGFGLWAVIEKASNEFIGQIGLTVQDIKGTPVLEIGYLLKKKFWKKGFATEAAIGCKVYAFGRLGYDEVYSIIRDNNIASQNVAKRIGMTVVGDIVKHYHGIDMPHLIFSVKRS